MGNDIRSENPRSKNVVFHKSLKAFKDEIFIGKIIFIYMYKKKIFTIYILIYSVLVYLFLPIRWATFVLSTLISFRIFSVYSLKLIVVGSL